MRKILFVLFACLLCASCTNKYSIEGVSSVSVLDGKKLYIKVLDGYDLVPVDSAEMIHGEFKMKGNVDSVVLASLFMDNDLIMPIIIEKGKIKINIDNSRMTIMGTPLNNKFNDFLTKKNVLDDRAYEIERLESRMIMDGKSPLEISEEIQKQRDQLGDDVDQLAKTFIQENYDNVLGPGVFIMFCNGLPYPVMTPVMEDIVKSAPESFTNNIYVRDFVAAARTNMEKMNGETN